MENRKNREKWEGTNTHPHARVWFRPTYQPWLRLYVLTGGGYISITDRGWSWNLLVETASAASLQRRTDGRHAGRQHVARKSYCLNWILSHTRHRAVRLCSSPAAAAAEWVSAIYRCAATAGVMPWFHMQLLHAVHCNYGAVIAGFPTWWKACNRCAIIAARCMQ